MPRTSKPCLRSKMDKIVKQLLPFLSRWSLSWFSLCQPLLFRPPLRRSRLLYVETKLTFTISFCHSFLFFPSHLLGITGWQSNSTHPCIPTKSAAQTYLNSLTVATSYDDGNYNRNLFPHWNTVSSTWNTRYVTFVAGIIGPTMVACCRMMVVRVNMQKAQTRNWRLAWRKAESKVVGPIK